MKMTLRWKVFGTAVVITLFGGLITARATTANAATPSCGVACIDIFSAAFGTPAQPNYLVAVSNGDAQPGSPIILSAAQNYNPAEDFEATAVGTVTSLYAASLVSSGMNQHYGSLDAYEIEYAPFGVAHELCVGVGRIRADEQAAVVLEPCGPSPSANVIWIPDPTLGATAVPLINAATTNPSDPAVLTDRLPLLRSGVQGQPLFISPLRHVLLNIHAVDVHQRWGALEGP